MEPPNRPRHHGDAHSRSRSDPHSRPRRDPRTWFRTPLRTWFRSGMRPQTRTRAFASGLAATLVFLGTADVLARLLGASTSPLTAVGLLVIRVMPTDLVKLAISLFGEADKLVLVLSVGLAGLVIGGFAGLLLRTRPRTALLALTAAEAALTLLVALRPESGAGDVIAAALGAVLGAFAFLLLLRAGTGYRSGGHPNSRVLRTSNRSPEDDGRDGRGGLDGRDGPAGRGGSGAPTGRRGFFTLAGAAVLVGSVGIACGRTITAVGKGAAEAARRIVLPAPAVPAPAVPDGAEVGVDGVAPFTTAQEDLYRIDTALVPPSIDPDTWELRVDGLVEEPFTLTFDDLLAMRLEEHRITLTCVSNPVGGDLLGTGTWTGMPIRELLDRAGVLPEADMVLSHSIDGFTASTPLEAMTDDRASLVAVGMNGEPLTEVHGFPARLIVPGLYGFVSATKWVTRIEVTRFDRAEAYWTQRGWDAEAPILVASRIDVPRGLEKMSAGDVVVAGSAWAQQHGVESVEVRLDDGDWQSADVGAEANIDSWRQWRMTLADVEPGRHSVTVRATDRSGTVQTDERRDPIPNSATGHHRVEFRVE
ncbi:molybdopterin-dependent oxidoreductase [Brevibacterium yomogidense]|uniref:molybdopterin-dependent oxidoreductase n=1 Tax=Brevibacterium yomogidense TaxID=946573 RepID=UPI0022B7665D|nr:molybdopterin-dependent oxidoreductase [Brevibacterium yomogidense]